MSMRYPGGFIASTPVTAAYPSGVWTQAQAIPYQAQNVWTRDQFWPYTTLLLQGNGTNGAQNNTFLDSSSNNFTITRNGNTTQGSFTPYEQDGYWSNASFSNSNYLTYNPGSSAAFGTGDFTVEAWVFATDALASGDNPYICDTRGGGGAWSLSWNYNGSSNPWQLAWANSSLLQSSTSMNINTWNHCAYVRSGTTGTLYLNGVSIATWTDNYNYSASVTSITIGRRYTISGGTAQYLPGYLSNFRIVKGTAVYTGAFTPPTAPLTAITNTVLLTCQSNRFIDNSSSAYTITVNGSPSVQAFQPFPGATTWSGTVLGGSGYFDGTGDNITAPSNAAFTFGTGDFTVEMWVYTSSSTSAMALVDARSTGTAVPWALYTTATALTPYFYDGSSLTSSIALTLNAWNHVAVARSSGTLRIFVNGVQGYSAANSTNISSTGTVQMGGAFSGAYYTGYISDLRIIKGTAVYTAAFTPPTAPLTAITNTSLLLNFTNAGIFDAAVMNDLETVGNAQVSTSVVKYGTGSMYFDGSGDYLKYLGTNVAGLGSGNFTIEFWINAPSLNDKFILGLRGGMSGSPHVTTGGYGGTTVGALRWASSAGEILSGTTVITDNTWHHCAIVRNGSTITLYVDGISRGSGTDTTAFDGNGGQILIGENNLGTNTFTGYLDDLRITKGAARYISNFTPPPARMPGQ